MSKHTPGPWITQWNSGCIEVIRLYEDGSFSRIPHAKVIDDFSFNQIRIRANSRLIAAAPELLAALNEIVIQIDQGGAGGKVFARDSCITAARAAIAKATGVTK